MASEAWLTINGRRIKIVEASELTEADRNKEFRCCGEDCNAQLVPRLGGIRQYFTAEDGLEQHVYGCPYKETYKGVRERTVSRLARSSDDFSFEDLFATLSKRKDGNGRPPGPHPGGGPEDDETDGQEDDRNSLFAVREKVRPPRTLQEILILFTELDIDTYGGSSVRDVLVDGRSISGHRLSGIRGTKIVIASARRLGEDVRAIIGRGDLYFEDAFTRAGSRNKLRLIVSVDGRSLRKEIGDKVFAKNSAGNWKYSAFALWGEWMETSISGVYRTTIRNKRQFLPLADGEYRRH